MRHGHRFVTVQHGIRGWFAVHFWWNADPDALGPDMENTGFYEPWESDNVEFSYATRQQAVDRAQHWAASLDVPFIDNP